MTARRSNERATVGRWIERNGLTRAEVAEVLGVTESGLSRKINGQRKWTVADAALLIKWGSRRLDRPVTFGELFS